MLGRDAADEAGDDGLDGAGGGGLGAGGGALRGGGGKGGGGLGWATGGGGALRAPAHVYVLVHSIDGAALRTPANKEEL